MVQSEPRHQGTGLPKLYSCWRKEADIDLNTFKLGSFSPAKVFFYANLIFLLGVALARWFDWRETYLIVALSTLVICLVYWWSNKVYRVVIILTIFLLLGFWRYQVSLPVNNSSQISFYNGQSVRLTGVICEEPDERVDQIKLTVCAQSLQRPVSAAVAGKILVKAPLYPKYGYGEEVSLKCQLWPPGSLAEYLASQNLASRFNYERYLSRYDIYSLCWSPEISVLKSGQGNKIISWLLQTKQGFVALINQSLPEPTAAFLNGLLLGLRRGIAPDLMEDFSRTGTTHILAISGYNITILALLLSEIGYWFYFSRKQVFWLVSIGLIFFVLITGGSASVVRAALMGWLIILAQRLGRTSQPRYILAATAAGMVWLNPKILWWDAGFQLSFAATLGLVYVSPVLQKLLMRLPDWGIVKESFCTTLSALILTMPLSLYYFGRLSLVAPLVNLLILPVIPWAMAAGAVMVLVAWLYLPLGQIVGTFAWLILSYIIYVVRFFAKLAPVGDLPISFSVVILVYIILVWLIIVLQKKVKSVIKF